jgi:hypothetical protein
VVKTAFARRLCVTSVAAGSVFGLCSCYSYRTEPVASLLPGRDARVTLTPGGARDLAVLIGDSAVAVDGRLIDGTATGVTFAVSGVQRLAAPASWHGERVTIPTSAIDHIGVRQLDGTRSALATLAVAATALAIRAVFLSSERPITTGSGSTGGAKYRTLNAVSRRTERVSAP